MARSGALVFPCLRRDAASCSTWQARRMLDRGTLNRFRPFRAILKRCARTLSRSLLASAPWVVGRLLLMRVGSPRFCWKSSLFRWFHLSGDLLAGKHRPGLRARVFLVTAFHCFGAFSPRRVAGAIDFGHRSWGSCFGWNRSSHTGPSVSARHSVDSHSGNNSVVGLSLSERIAGCFPGCKT